MSGVLGIKISDLPLYSGAPPSNGEVPISVGGETYKFQGLGDFALKGDVYTKQEVDDSLDEKADIANVYTKSEVDNELSTKADADDVYTKGDVDNFLSNKADADDVYDKSTIDGFLSNKANVSDVYDIFDVDNLLLDKADADDVYSISEIDSMFSGLSFSDYYLKSEVDALLTSKANAASVYTKAEVDGIVSGINTSGVEGKQDKLNLNNYEFWARGSGAEQAFPISPSVLNLVTAPPNDFGYIPNNGTYGRMVYVGDFGGISGTPEFSALSYKGLVIGSANNYLPNLLTVDEDSVDLEDPSRVWKLPAKDGVIALTQDLSGVESGILSNISANYYDKTSVDSALSLKADSGNVYNKTETDSLLSGKQDLISLSSANSLYGRGRFGAQGQLNLYSQDTFYMSNFLVYGMWSTDDNQPAVPFTVSAREGAGGGFDRGYLSLLGGLYGPEIFYSGGHGALDIPYKFHHSKYGTIEMPMKGGTVALLDDFRYATTTQSGVVNLATVSEVQAGTDSSKVLTPATAAATYVPVAGTPASGDVGEILEAYLSSDDGVSLAVSNQYYATLSLYLPAGVYLLVANINVASTGSGVTRVVSVFGPTPNSSSGFTDGGGVSFYENGSSGIRLYSFSYILNQQTSGTVYINTSAVFTSGTHKAYRSFKAIRLRKGSF